MMQALALTPSTPQMDPKERYLTTIAGGYGMTLRILNKREHWQFTRASLLVEWWPSSSRVAVNKNWKRRLFAHDAEAMRKLLAKAQSMAGEKVPSQCAPKQKRQKGSISSRRDLEPNYSRKCDNCENVGAIPFSGMCGPCTYGTAEEL